MLDASTTGCGHSGIQTQRALVSDVGHKLSGRLHSGAARSPRSPSSSARLYRRGAIGAILTLSYTPLPRPSYVDQLDYLGARNGERRWRSRDGNLYTYDGQHCELEVFNSRGRHIGVADVYTGAFIKPARRGRRIDV
ncbi:colicin E3/pyocin S6 family cytotoxin [Phytohabitans kaempferiae]|uniref:Colicin E3/pyocin S6 family cytotoxin n=1 Tax=Phytohabitans kaempferiae TaxID=1620943 RepID=A0ABV6MEN2_9ACTN